MAKSSFWSDFKAFITKGNVIDMAVGVVIGGAFGKIVTGLVNYIINPCISLISGGTDLDGLKTVLREAVPATDTTAEVTEISIFWGMWIQTIIDFLIVAFCIFLVLRVIMKAKNKLNEKKLAEEAAAKAKADAEAAEKAATAAAELSAKQEKLEQTQFNQEKILAEIRDLLQKK